MPVPRGYIYITIPTVRAQGNLRRRGWKSVKDRGLGSMFQGRRYGRDVILINHQQYGSLNKTWKITTPIDVPMWIEEISWWLILTVELYVLNNYQNRELVFFRRSVIIIYLISTDQTLKYIHKHITWIGMLYLCICSHIYVCACV